MTSAAFLSRFRLASEAKVADMPACAPGRDPLADPEAFRAPHIERRFNNAG